MSVITMIPTYGRDYSSGKAVREDFHAGKDFLICDMSSRWDGEVANKQSLIEDGITTARIRFNKQTGVVMIPVGEKWPKPEKHRSPKTYTTVNGVTTKIKGEAIALASPDPEDV